MRALRAKAKVEFGRSVFGSRPPPSSPPPPDSARLKNKGILKGISEATLRVPRVLRELTIHNSDRVVEARTSVGVLLKQRPDT